MPKILLTILLLLGIVQVQAVSASNLNVVPLAGLFETQNFKIMDQYLSDNISESDFKRGNSYTTTPGNKTGTGDLIPFKSSPLLPKAGSTSLDDRPIFISLFRDDGDQNLNGGKVHFKITSDKEGSNIISDGDSVNQIGNDGYGFAYYKPTTSLSKGNYYWFSKSIDSSGQESQEIYGGDFSIVDDAGIQLFAEKNLIDGGTTLNWTIDFDKAAKKKITQFNEKEESSSSIIENFDTSSYGTETSDKYKGTTGKSLQIDTINSIENINLGNTKNKILSFDYFHNSTGKLTGLKLGSTYTVEIGSVIDGWNHIEIPMIEDITIQDIQLIKEGTISNQYLDNVLLGDKVSLINKKFIRDGQDFIRYFEDGSLVKLDGQTLGVKGITRIEGISELEQLEIYNGYFYLMSGTNFIKYNISEKKIEKVIPGVTNFGLAGNNIYIFDGDKSIGLVDGTDLEIKNGFTLPSSVTLRGIVFGNNTLFLLKDDETNKDTLISAFKVNGGALKNIYTLDSGVLKIENINGTFFSMGEVNIISGNKFISIKAPETEVKIYRKIGSGQYKLLTVVNGDEYKDLGGKDITKPNKPSILTQSIPFGDLATSDPITVTLNDGVDNGQKIAYKLGIDISGEEITSNEIEKDYKSGIAGYYYEFSKNPNITETEPFINTTVPTFTNDDFDGKMYLHAIAFDKEGNSSDVMTAGTWNLDNVGPKIDDIKMLSKKYQNGDPIIFTFVSTEAFDGNLDIKIGGETFNGTCTNEPLGFGQVKYTCTHQLDHDIVDNKMYLSVVGKDSTGNVGSQVLQKKIVNGWIQVVGGGLASDGDINIGNNVEQLDKGILFGISGQNASTVDLNSKINVKVSQKKQFTGLPKNADGTVDLKKLYGRAIINYKQFEPIDGVIKIDGVNKLQNNKVYYLDGDVIFGENGPVLLSGLATFHVTEGHTVTIKNNIFINKKSDTVKYKNKIGLIAENGVTIEVEPKVTEYGFYKIKGDDTSKVIIKSNDQ